MITYTKILFFTTLAVFGDSNTNRFMFLDFCKFYFVIYKLYFPCLNRISHSLHSKSLLSLFEIGYINNKVSLSKIQMINALVTLVNDYLSEMNILIGVNKYCLLSVDTLNESLDFIRTMTDSLWFSLVLCCQV